MMNKALVAVGQKAQFDPWDGISGTGVKEFRKVVTGTVIAVYPEHKWFSVVYGVHKLRTSFKFCDIGDGVKVFG